MLQFDDYVLMTGVFITALGLLIWAFNEILMGEIRDSIVIEGTEND